jgi:very-short-patch-repair endonuclease
MTRKLNIPNLDDLIQMYESGMSMKQLSDNCGIPRISLVRHFRKKGIHIRGNSEAERLKWSKMNPTQRKRQVQKAHEAARLKKHSIETKIKAAKTFYQKCLRVGLFESEIFDILKKRYNVSQQFNVGIYNIDIAIHEPPIAIEVQMSNRKTLRSKNGCKRLKYLISKGYFVVFVVSKSEHPPIEMDIFSVAEKIISYVNILSSDKSFFGNYVMIGCDGKPFPHSRFNCNDVPRIE